jgi:hypothetical protein
MGEDIPPAADGAAAPALGAAAPPAPAALDDVAAGAAAAGVQEPFAALAAQALLKNLTAASDQAPLLHSTVHDPHAGHAHLKPQQASFVLWATILVFILGQAGLVQLKKHFPRQYNAVSLLGLWLVPVVFAVRGEWIRFLVVWALFSAVAGYLLFAASRKPVAKETPRRIYFFLDVTYRACLAGASGSWGLLAFLIVFPPVAMILPTVLIDLFLSGGIYCVYFGVLIRDIGELAAETMATSLGYTRRKGDDDDDNHHGDDDHHGHSHGGGGGDGRRGHHSGGAGAQVGRASSSRAKAHGACALCGGGLRIVGEGSAVEEIEEGGGLDGLFGGVGGLDDFTEPVLMRAPDGSLVLIRPGIPIRQQVEEALAARKREAAEAAAVAARVRAAAQRARVGGRADESSEAEEVQSVLKFPGHDGSQLFQLQCKHVFHEGCILGWCVVGKKNTCPSCSERVDLTVLLKTNPLWGRPSLLWGRVLDFVRYVVVWNPLAFLVLRLVFWEAGIPIGPPPQGSLEAAAGGAGAGAGAGGIAGAGAAATPGFPGQ